MTSAYREPIDRDRREKLKTFPIKVPVSYELMSGGQELFKGTGHTISLSSTGVVFDAGETLPIGRTVQLRIDWPVQLQNKADLTLAVTGKTVETQGTLARIEMIRHEFRIRPLARRASA